jgi:hypothetical protein
MDSFKSGNARTMKMHQEMQIRNTQRHAAQETAQAADRGGLNVAMVTGVSPTGGVQLEGFTMAGGNGTWFGVLNHVTPRVGEFVVYGYVQGVPVVFGVAPSECTTPWRGPRSGLPDYFFKDDFDIGSTAGGGWIGNGHWTWAFAAGSSISLGSGTDDHPGVVNLGAGNAVDQYSYSHILSVIHRPEAISEAEWMIRVNSASQAVANGLWQVGFTNSGTAGTQGIICRHDPAIAGWSSTTWNFEQTFAGTTNMGDTGVPVITDHWYKINFKHLPAPGSWRLTVTDVTDPTNPIEGQVEASGFQTTVPVLPWHRVYNRGTNGEKWMVVDYVWWSRLGLKRGGI